MGTASINFIMSHKPLLLSTSLRLPFIGSRGNGEPFDYLLMKLNPDSGLIASPSWLTHPTLLSKGEQINLHLHRCSRQNSSSETSPVKALVYPLEDSRLRHEAYYRFQFEAPFACEVISSKNENPTEQEINNQIIEVIKDSLLRKSGVNIYLKHLIPYLARIIDTWVKKRYHELRTDLFDHVHKQVENHREKIEELYLTFKGQPPETAQIPLDLDIELVRQYTRSEIDIELFSLALENEPGNAEQEQPLLNSCYPRQPHLMYLEAIKVAEQRLYDNFNYIVALHTINLSYFFSRGFNGTNNK